ncbi:MAG: ABC transporter permease [Gemmatimonadota bacterium]|jgi:predicted permease
MSRIPGLRRVFRLTVGRSGVEKDVEEEIRFHLEARKEELVREGMAPREAAARAEAEFGDVAKYRKQMRSLGRRRSSRIRRADLRDAFRQDLSFAFRQLWRNKGFTSAASVTLALGVGATTAIFSVVNGVLLKPLPYPDPDRLVAVRYVSNSTGTISTSLSQPDIQDLQDQASSLSYLSGYSATNRTLTGMGDPEVIRGAQVTQGLFETFAVTPTLGRDIRAEENTPGGPKVVVISHAFWTERFGSDPEVIGKTVLLDGTAHEIVGVAPPRFEFPREAQFWLPAYMDLEGCGRDCHLLRGIGRLTSDATLGGAQSEATAIAARLEETYVDSNYDRGFQVMAQHSVEVQESRTALLVLLGSVVMVLLIACANVANLLLVRGTNRTGEIALRSALGAGRGRVLTQLLVENAVLATLGGGSGLLLAHFGLEALLKLAPSSLPYLDQVGVDGTVLLFTLGTVSLVSLLFGLVPALRLARIPISNALKEGGRARLGGVGRDRSRSLMLVGEVALSLMLLLGSGLLLQSFTRLSSVDPGFDSENVHRFTLSLPDAGYETPEEGIGFFQSLEERIAALPGVRSVGSIWGAPLSEVGITAGFEHSDRPPPPPGQEPSAAWRVVTPGYFEAMGIPLLQGRGFEDRDCQGDQPVTVVNQSFVDRFFPGEDPVGKPIQFMVSMSLPEKEPRTIVGVVGDARYDNMGEPPTPAFYVPESQIGSDYLTTVVKTMPVMSPMLAITDIVRSMDPDLPLRDVEEMTVVVDRSLGPARFNLLLLGIFTALAVGLTAVGLYGVVAYLVSQRTREIAIRMALGARSESVVRMVLGQGIRPALVGAALGLAGAFAGSRLLTALLYGIEPTDPTSYLGATGLLLLVVVGAATLPAARASRIAPMKALKQE